jgi:hypothetical protein
MESGSQIQYLTIIYLYLYIIYNNIYIFTGIVIHQWIGKLHENVLYMILYIYIYIYIYILLNYSGIYRIVAKEGEGSNPEPRSV